MKLIKIVVVGATAAACQGKKLRGHGKKEVPNRKLGTYWIPSDASSGTSYSIYTGSNDVAPLGTNKPTRRPTKKPTNEPTTWMGDAYPTLSPTLK
jgi:hypothetical protein